MFYPFPRCSAQSTWRPPSWPAALPPSEPHQATAHTAPPASSLENSGSSSAAALEEDANGSFELNDDLIAYFAKMEARRVSKLSGRGGQYQHSRSSSCATRAAVALPAQEDAASQAAQVERLQAHERQARLYGAERAAELRALGARLNREFDRVVHTTNPPLWPSAPLRY